MIMLPFLCPVSKWLFTHKEYNKQYPETYLDEIQEWIDRVSINKIFLCLRFDNHSIFIDVFNIWASPGERYNTVAWLDHLLLVRTSVTINEVYSLKCLLEFVSFTTFAPCIVKERDETRRTKYRRIISQFSRDQLLFNDESAKRWEDFSGNYQYN